MARTPPFALKSFHDMQRRLAEGLRCKTCAKLTVVRNVATRGFKPERVTKETHCTCPGGTVEQMDRAVVKPLHVVTARHTLSASEADALCGLAHELIPFAIGDHIPAEYRSLINHGLAFRSHAGITITDKGREVVERVR